MDILIKPLLSVISLILDLFKMCVFGYIILGWLELFKVINPYNRFVYTVHNILFSLVEPALNPIRRFIPSFSGIDLAPVALIIGVYFLQGVIYQIVLKFPG